MKTERKDNPLKAIPDEILDHCNFDTEKGLVATISPGLLIVSSTKMTAMDTMTAIAAISEFGASLATKLAADIDEKAGTSQAPHDIIRAPLPFGNLGNYLLVGKKTSIDFTIRQSLPAKSQHLGLKLF